MEADKKESVLEELENLEIVALKEESKSSEAIQRDMQEKTRSRGEFSLTQQRLTEQIKQKEESDKQVLSWDTQLQNLKRTVVTERSMLKKEQEVADERIAIQMSRAEQRQKQHTTAAKVAAEALKLLQSE